MISRLSEAFGCAEENEVEKMMLEPEVIQAIDIFFSAAGPTRIVITMEVFDENNNNSNEKLKLTANTKSIAKGSIVSPSNERVNKLKVHLYDIGFSTSTAVYFMKVKRGKDNDDQYAIDPNKINDGTMSFGIFHQPLESLEVVMRCVYKPLIQDMNTEMWGHTSVEHKSEFIGSIDMFTRGLQESIRSVTGGLELRKPDERVETQGSLAAADPTLVVNSLNLLQEWCNKIEKYLDDSDRSRWETPDSGPDTEVDYWRSRMQRYFPFVI
jgi:dynein heavy chain